MNQFANHQSLPDLRRVRYVASHYPQIQGLRLLPFGVWLLLMTAYEYFTKPHGFVPTQEPGWLTALLYVAGPVLVLLLYGFIGSFYYNHTFGNVQPVKQQVRGFSGCFTGVLGALFLLSFISSRAVLQQWGSLGFALMVLLFVAWWRSDWYRKDYALLLVVVAIVTLLPILRSTPPDLIYRTTAMIIFAVTIIVGAILDHLLLVRTFKPVPGE